MNILALDPAPEGTQMQDAIEILVLGKPEPAGSKRGFAFKRKTGGIGVAISDANPNSKGWQQQVKAAAFNAYGGQPMEGPLRLTVLFCMVRPKGHYGSGRNANVLKPSAPPWFSHVTKPDTLKLTRGVEDALTGIIWKDDCQVVQESLMKCYAERAGVLIRVERYEPTAEEFEMYAATMLSELETA